jgi:phosphoribosylformylglycinamidine cyclo-ligase
LIFLDYVAVGKNVPERVAQIVSGVADGCVLAGCALVGGETAEMPGFYPVDEYDLAGFTVGVVDKDKIIDKTKVKAGDVLIGLASSGVHSNGFSLVRKVFNISEKNINMYIEELGCTLGEELLKPTKIYVKPVLKLIDEIGANAISHITGGGFYENIPRMLPFDLKAVINKSSFPVLPVFNMIKSTGNIGERDMFNTFNMGIGMIIAIDSKNADKAVKLLNAQGEQAYIIGEVANGENGVEIN